MKLFITAKPESREEQVTKIDPPVGRAGETHYSVAVKEPPVQGRANAAIVRALAARFGVSASRVHIVAGHTARRKIVEIYETEN